MVQVLSEKDTCNVKWRNGEYLPAMVLERRKNREKVWEYYVHYISQDRRLDEWASIDRFQLESLQRHVDASSVDAPPPPEETARRRRSSASHVTMADEDDEFVPMLTGGNWHGVTSRDPVLATLEREHEETTKIKNIESIVLGNFLMDAWYFSPFPTDYHGISRLYVCEYCLSYFRKQATYRKHLEQTCRQRGPPGKRIYHEPQDDHYLDVYEIDGNSHKLYCQKLCLLAKLFLDHKTLYFDVSLFNFYVVCKVDGEGSHLVGYFSKEKHSEMQYNLACILTFPPYQQAGYGKFIISCSYALSQRQGVTGSPEKPLSDLGKVSYRSYWKHVLLHALNADKPPQSLHDLSLQTAIQQEDILSTLGALEMIYVYKGQHVIHVQQEKLQEYCRQEKKIRLCKPEFLTWEGKKEEEKK